MSIRQKMKQYQFYKFLINTKIWRKCSKRYYNWKQYRLYCCCFYKPYYGKSKSYYLDRVARWMYKHRISQGNIVSIVSELEEVACTRKTDEKRICFLVEYISPRVIKIARALVEEGFLIESFISQNVDNAGGYLEDLENTSECIRYYSIEELMFYLINSRAIVIHCFTEWLSCAEVNVLLYQQQLFPKIVVERYDVITGMYTKELTLYYEEILKQEKYAMENAAGVCFRNFTKEYLEKEFGFSYKGVCITFLDYYDKEMEMTTEFNNNDTKSLSFCYAGGIVTEKTCPGSRVACHLEFAELCKQHKCHYHVYPSRWNEEEYSDYIELEKHNSYFHFHHPVKYEDLGRELVKYDYGVVPSRKGDSVISGQSVYQKEQWIYGTSNKCFDYICFGLPIIQNDQAILVEEFASKDLLLPWDIEQFDFDELCKYKSKMKESNLRNRYYYRMDNRIHELISFYRSL